MFFNFEYFSTLTIFQLRTFFTELYLTFKLIFFKKKAHHLGGIFDWQARQRLAITNGLAGRDKTGKRGRERKGLSKRHREKR
jgi:hypothetical protein